MSNPLISGERENKYRVDVTKVTLKLTYFGLIFGILAPGLYLLVGYLADGPGRQTFSDSDKHQVFFWIFLGLSVVVAVASFFLKKILFSKPLIHSETTFASDFADGMHARSLTLYALINLIAVFGLIFFFMGGDLDGLMLFCLVSVIVFQLFRPRPGFIEDSLVHQEQLVSEGNFTKQTRK